MTPCLLVLLVYSTICPVELRRLPIEEERIHNHQDEKKVLSYPDTFLSASLPSVSETARGSGSSSGTFEDILINDDFRFSLPLTEADKPVSTASKNVVKEPVPLLPLKLDNFKKSHYDVAQDRSMGIVLTHEKKVLPDPDTFLSAFLSSFSKTARGSGSSSETSEDVPINDVFRFSLPLTEADKPVSTASKTVVKEPVPLLPLKLDNFKNSYDVAQDRSMGIVLTRNQSLYDNRDRSLVLPGGSFLTTIVSGFIGFSKLLITFLTFLVAQKYKIIVFLLLTVTAILGLTNQKAVLSYLSDVEEVLGIKENKLGENVNIIKDINRDDRDLDQKLSEYERNVRADEDNKGEPLISDPGSIADQIIGFLTSAWSSIYPGSQTSNEALQHINLNTTKLSQINTSSDSSSSDKEGQNLISSELRNDSNVKIVLEEFSASTQSVARMKNNSRVIGDKVSSTSSIGNEVIIDTDGSNSNISGLLIESESSKIILYDNRINETKYLNNTENENISFPISNEFVPQNALEQSIHTVAEVDETPNGVYNWLKTVTANSSSIYSNPNSTDQLGLAKTSSSSSESGSSKHSSSVTDSISLNVSHHTINPEANSDELLLTEPAMGNNLININQTEFSVDVSITTSGISPNLTTTILPNNTVSNINNDDDDIHPDISDNTSLTTISVGSSPQQTTITNDVAQQFTDTSSPLQQTTNVSSPAQQTTDMSNPAQQITTTSSPAQQTSDTSSPAKQTTNSSAKQNTDTNSSAKQPTTINSPTKQPTTINSPAKQTSDASSPTQQSSTTSGTAKQTSITTSPAQQSTTTNSPAKRTFDISSPTKQTTNKSSPAQQTSNTSSPVQTTTHNTRPAQPTTDTSSPDQQTTNTGSSPAQPTTSTSTLSHLNSNTSSSN